MSSSSAETPPEAPGGSRTPSPTFSGTSSVDSGFDSVDQELVELHEAAKNSPVQGKKAVGDGNDEKPFLTIKEWKDQCEYQCRECGKMFIDTNSCKRHVVDIHKLDLSNYKEKYGMSSMATKEKTYTCFFCNRNVVWSYGSLSFHSRKHKMTMKEMYEKEYVLHGPFSQIHEDPKDDTNDDIQNIIEDNNSVKAMVLTFKEWKDQCEHQCLHCEKIFLDLASCKRHVMNAHKLDLSVYQAKHGLSPIKSNVKKYTCFLCDKTMQWSHSSLKKHSKLHHKMTLKEMYEREYVLHEPYECKGTKEETIDDIRDFIGKDE